MSIVELIDLSFSVILWKYEVVSLSIYDCREYGQEYKKS